MSDASDDASRTDRGRTDCPLCALWNSCRDSDAAKHLRGIGRESVLLARSLLDACIRAAEEFPDRRSER